MMGASFLDLLVDQWGWMKHVSSAHDEGLFLFKGVMMKTGVDDFLSCCQFSVLNLLKVVFDLSILTALPLPLLLLLLGPISLFCLCQQLDDP